MMSFYFRDRIRKDVKNVTNYLRCNIQLCMLLKSAMTIFASGHVSIKSNILKKII